MRTNFGQFQSIKRLVGLPIYSCLLFFTFSQLLNAHEGDHSHGEAIKEAPGARPLPLPPGYRVPNLVPLYRIYSETLKDHMLTTNPNHVLRAAPVYAFEGIAGYVSAVPDDLAPQELVLFYAGAPRHDSFLSASPEEIQSLSNPNSNYQYFGSIGYCSLRRHEGQCPLFRMFYRGKHVDHFYTTSENDPHILIAGQRDRWFIEGITCFIYCNAT